MLVHVSILRSSAGSTYCSLLKLHVKIVIIIFIFISDVAAYAATSLINIMTYSQSYIKVGEVPSNTTVVK